MDNILIAKTHMNEGQRATFTINGVEYTRVVRYNTMDGLYVVVNNRKYFEYEFDYQIGGKE